jgi:hypothetical protein
VIRIPKNTPNQGKYSGLISIDKLLQRCGIAGAQPLDQEFVCGRSFLELPDFGCTTGARLVEESRIVALFFAKPLGSIICQEWSDHSASRLQVSGVSTTESIF